MQENIKIFKSGWIVWNVAFYQTIADRLKGESITKLPRKLLESCSPTLVAKLKDSLTGYLLVVSGSKIGTKHFTRLHVGFVKQIKLVRKTDNHQHIFYTPYNYSRPSSCWCQMFSCFFRHAVRVNKLFINYTDAFFLTGNKNSRNCHLL